MFRALHRLNEPYCQSKQQMEVHPLKQNNILHVLNPFLPTYSNRVNSPKQGRVNLKIRAEKFQLKPQHMSLQLVKLKSFHPKTLSLSLSVLKIALKSQLWSNCAPSD